MLNAQLMPIILNLLTSVKNVLSAHRIEVPLMIVRGDGTLMNETQALKKPVETIMSGPVCSAYGAVFLSGKQNALISDMGGTTMDIARVINGKFEVVENGADIGGWSTHARVANIFTVGLGGDSRIFINHEGVLSAGPEKSIPLCRAATMWQGIVPELSRIMSMQDDKSIDMNLEFFVCTSPLPSVVSAKERSLLSHMIDTPRSLQSLIDVSPDVVKTLDSLVKRDVISRISLTPTDILHVTSEYVKWSVDASTLAITILSRRLCISFDRFLFRFKETFKSLINNALVASSLHFDSCYGEYSVQSHTHPDLSDMTVFPTVAVGAPAHAWLKSNCGAPVHIPIHADVANAVGAAVCRIAERTKAVIRFEKTDKCYTAYTLNTRRQFDDLLSAHNFCTEEITSYFKEPCHGGYIDYDLNFYDFYSDDHIYKTKEFIERTIEIEFYKKESH